MSIIDWSKYPEPWRQIGKEWIEMRPAIIKGGSSHETKFFAKEFQRWRIHHFMTCEMVAERLNVSLLAIEELEHARLPLTNHVITKARNLMATS